MGKRKEPLLGASPKGDAGIVYRTMVRLGRGDSPVESKVVFEAAASQPLLTPSEALSRRVRELIKSARGIPEIHTGLHRLLGDPETSGGYTLPRISSVTFARLKEYSPVAYERLKGSIPTKNGSFLLVLAKSRSGSWKLIV